MKTLFATLVVAVAAPAILNGLAGESLAAGKPAVSPAIARTLNAEYKQLKSDIAKVEQAIQLREQWQTLNEHLYGTEKYRRCVSQIRALKSRLNWIDQEMRTNRANYSGAKGGWAMPHDSQPATLFGAAFDGGPDYVPKVGDPLYVSSYCKYDKRTTDWLKFSDGSRYCTVCGRRP